MMNFTTSGFTTSGCFRSLFTGSGTRIEAIIIESTPPRLMSSPAGTVASLPALLYGTRASVSERG